MTELKNYEKAQITLKELKTLECKMLRTLPNTYVTGQTTRFLDAAGKIYANNILQLAKMNATQHEKDTKALLIKALTV